MRIVIIGGGDVGVMTARTLLERNAEVVIVDSDADRIDTLAENLSCGFLHGDGSKPDILKEAGPKQTDILFCLTGDDLVNIVASVIGVSLSYKRVVTRIEDPSYEDVCRQLELKDTIVPNRTISRYLADLSRGRDILELSTMITGEARFFSFEATERDKGRVKDLGLPAETRVICYYRDAEFSLADQDTHIKAGDRVIVLTHSRHVEALRERWHPEHASKADRAAERGGHVESGN
jgi:trk system potassium uptake protein TrkA